LSRTPPHQGLLVVPPEQFGAAALAAFRHALAHLEEPVIGFPTGRTPVALYDEMAVEAFVFPEGARLFAIDEYCSREPNPGTNASFFAQHLPSPPYPRIQVPKHDPADPEAEIAHFANQITSAGGFSVAVLGIGMNGHIAFNEPGSEADSNARIVRLAESTRDQVAHEWDPAPVLGMTVGMADLLSAERLLLLVNGPAKAKILAAALEGPVTADVPASLLQGHPALTVVCDSAAAALLRNETTAR
jgi:glucosamine-6-phosphate deaminase